MKNPMVYNVLGLALLFAASACTMGDKGSERVPDSVKIDTVERPKAQSDPDAAGKPLIDSLQTDTGQYPMKAAGKKAGQKVDSSTSR